MYPFQIKQPFLNIDNLIRKLFNRFEKALMSHLLRIIKIKLTLYFANKLLNVSQSRSTIKTVKVIN